MAAKPPDAFLSYTRFDDKPDGGAISEFCRRLASAVRAVSGISFEIFQDVEGIGVGEHWPGKLDQMLNEARFFIPIVTPNYFTSRPCRQELEKFLRAEAERERNDLVLPIYYIECELLEDDDLRPVDPLASTLHERQRQDWRELRFEPFEAAIVRRALEQLAREIVKARRRPMRQAEEEAQNRAEEAGRKAEEEARRQAAAAEAERLAEKKARVQAEQEARRRTKEEATRQAAAAEAERLAEEEARKQAEDSAEQERNPQISLSRPAGRLEITKTVDSGSVRQSFSNARSKSVAVEVKRKRQLKSPGPEAGAPAARDERAAARRGVVLKPLTEEEKTARVRALADARRAEEEARRRAAEPGLSFEAGMVLRDIKAPWCPDLVMIPPGEFMMGSTEAERQWAVTQGAKREWVEWEKPQHLVKIAYPLAVGRYPITFEEYGHFARSAGRGQPGDEGWGRGWRPVINVDWEDARSFVAWLSVQAGQRYRLLSEAEWEYACRTGTTTRYWWGDEITPGNANYDWSLGRTSEVGSYPASPFGLYDTHGNVWEWVEDRWHDSYAGAPEDGSAWTAGNDSRRVVRGGSWSRNPAGLRSASRAKSRADDRNFNFGFRVARTLTS